MGNKKNSVFGVIATGIFVGIVILIVGNPIADFFSKPDLIGNTQGGTTSICPPYLDFSRDVSKFRFSFANLGDDTGSFFATVSSNEAMSRYQNSGDDFKETSSKSWFADVGKEIGFDFELKRVDEESPVKTISVNVAVVCTTSVVGAVDVGCGERQLSCKYELDDEPINPTSYNLVK